MQLTTLEKPSVELPTNQFLISEKETNIPKLKKSELIEEMKKTLMYSQEAFKGFELPIGFEDDKFKKEFSKDYENATMYNLLSLTKLLLSNHQKKLQKKELKAKEKELVLAYEEKAPATFLDLRQRLIDKEKLEIEKANQAKENKAKTENWDNAAQIIQKQTVDRQAVISHDIKKLKATFATLTMESQKFEESLPTIKFTNISNFEQEWAKYETRLDNANIIFSLIEDIVKKELVETKKRSYQPNQKQFHDQLESHWNETCLSMLSLLSKRQKIDIFLQTIPMLSDLLERINKTNGEIIMNKRKYEDKILNDGYLCLANGGHRTIPDNHPTRNDMGSLVKKYTPIFYELDKEIAKDVDYEIADELDKVNSEKFNKKNLVLKKFFDTIPNTDTPQYTFKPLKDLFFPLKLQLEHKERFANEKNLNQLQKLISESHAEYKVLWETITNLIKTICNNHDDMSQQLNQILDGSNEGYLIAKTYYNKNSSIGNNLGVYEKSEYVHPTVTYNPKDPEIIQQF